jgi:hypothetical protein
MFWQGLSEQISAKQFRVGGKSLTVYGVLHYVARQQSLISRSCGGSFSVSSSLVSVGTTAELSALV